MRGFKMDDVDHDSDVAEKDGDGGVTANNQAGQTEQEILDDAAGLTTFDVQFKCSTTVEASTPEEAHTLACRYWDEHRKRTTDELNIVIRPL